MHRARTVHLDGFAPYHDPHTQTTGLALVGRF
jgi:hypothetical protein